MLRSLLRAADGVVGIDEVFQNAFLEEVPFWTTPSAPLKEASRLLLDVASTPPMSGGEWHAQFIHTFFDPPTDITWTRSLKTEGNSPVSQPTPFPATRVASVILLLVFAGQFAYAARGRTTMRLETSENSCHS